MKSMPYQAERLDLLTVHIRTGRTFREAPLAGQEGDVRVLTFKDVQGDRIRSEAEARADGSLVRCESSSKWEGELLQPGDILFTGKSWQSKAVWFDLPERAIASGLFVVVRPDEHVIDPHYLFWYLNTPTAQAHFSRNVVGTLVSNVPISALRELLVPVPPLDVQRTIGKAHAANLLTRSTYLRLAEDTYTFHEQQLMDLVSHRPSLNA